MLTPSTISQYSVVYFEPEVDNKYKLPAKPKLVLVPDSEIQMVSNYLKQLLYAFINLIFLCAGESGGAQTSSFGTFGALWHFRSGSQTDNNVRI